MDFRDDDLSHYAAHGTPPLPVPVRELHVEHAGASIWCGVYGEGAPVLLLHGAFNQSADWSRQIAALTEAGYRAIAIDNRGRGRSTLGIQPLSYALEAEEVFAVMDALDLPAASIVGWSDGSIIGLTMAMQHPQRVACVFAFGTVMHLDGLTPLDMDDPVLGRMFKRVKHDHARFSPEAERFEEIAQAVGQMTDTQPTYGDAELAAIRVPVAIVVGERDEFIARGHTEHLAEVIPGAELITLPGGTHFALLQRPQEFNRAMLDYIGDSVVISA
ncbi:alpha/beta hydrolase [Dyella sp. LX-66]|uniref:alpha/beta fold hydrolase n=1 Tax=unclassified Dyella TaxID=2634549 RepID=UPI001BE01968|nr:MULTISPECIES: alpha/beta hydrolase [unclassified Dyella]MBT2118413.1 alpha/beta hydrolase [Dyella sp. LX-1]MBT2141915.1 alpha/beta hydrolase [Dyella sp. LX-66]